MLIAEHWPDDWTAVTADGRKSAQFEETILITETGVEILTRAPASSSKKNKKKKKKTNANANANSAAANGNGDGEADGEEDVATPTTEVAQGVAEINV